MHHPPIDLTATTGQSCPESGLWQHADGPSAAVPIAKGDIMPPYLGKVVTWRLVQRAEPSPCESPDPRSFRSS